MPTHRFNQIEIYSHTMRKELEIVIENTQQRVRTTPGLSLAEVAAKFNITLKYPILGAMVNHQLKELDYEVYSPKVVKYIDISHPAGTRMYHSSLFFVLQKAVRDTLPGCNVRIEHAVSNGYYCEIEGYNQPVELPLVFKIGDRMRELVAANMPIVRDKVLTADAANLFQEMGYTDKAKLFGKRTQLYTSVYRLDDSIDHFFSNLVPSTGYLKVFDLAKYYNGMLLMVPRHDNPNEIAELVLQSKMFDIFQEHKDWSEIIGASSVVSINAMATTKQSTELIQVAEALHEKKVAQIADQISSRREKVRLVLLSGPSSSGKTTTAKRIAVQLKVNGLTPHIVSMDNYFVNRQDTPLDEDGNYDFEAVEAVDIPKFNEDLLRLMDGEQVEMPKFSFETGQRFYDGTTLQIPANGIIIVEGIHALNPKLTAQIDDSRKFRVYVSALTSLSIDGINRVATSDNRMLRRMIRDYRYRGYSAQDTLSRWPSVRRGENRHIFPHQENADAMFNSSLLYEFGVLKTQAVQILQQVQPNVEEYSEAQRLLNFLSYIEPISDKEVPPTSILREFLGGSTFSYR